MRILIIADCYLPSEKSSARLVHDLAAEFTRQGNQATILAPSDTGAGGIERCADTGITVVRFKTGQIKGARHAVRAVNEMSMSLLAYARCRRMLLNEPHDLIVFYSPSIFFGPLVAWLKRKWGAKTYLVLRDIFPDWAVDMGVLKKGAVYRVFKGFERFQYRAADVIGVETSRSVDYFQGSAHSGKVELLRNWTPAQDPPPATGQFRRQLGLENKIVFFYGGNIGVAQDMDNIMRLAGRMQDKKEVHFLLVGAGSEVDRLQRRIREEEIPNVTIHPAVDQDTYFAMLAEFDVGLVSLDRRLKTYSNTGKILGYMRCGLPMLASHNPGNDLSDLLHESGAGLGSINGDDEQFYANALQLCDAATRRRMGAFSRRLLQDHFAVEAITRQILRSAK